MKLLIHTYYKIRHLFCLLKIFSAILVSVCRDLVTYVEWNILSKFDDDTDQLDCQLLLVEHLPSGIYIDPDQIKNEEQFGGPEVRFDTKHKLLSTSFIGASLPGGSHIRRRFLSEFF